jgi:hypothetical protein
MYNIYLKVNSDGENSEGIGSMAQYQLIAYGLSKHLNLKYAFLGFKNLQHYQHHSQYNKNSWCELFNNYFNFPNELFHHDYDEIKMGIYDLFNYIKTKNKLNKDLVIDINPKELFHLNVNDYKQHINKLSDNINHKIQLDKTKNNISIHIRSLNKIDTDLDPVRDYFDETKTSYYSNLINNIDKVPTKKEKIYHIHSQTEETKLKFLEENINSKIIYHINSNPCISLSYMIQSDLLVGSKSSFSYIAHLLNKNKSLFRNNFWMHLYHQTFLIDENGNFKI